MEQWTICGKHTHFILIGGVATEERVGEEQVEGNERKITNCFNGSRERTVAGAAIEMHQKLHPSIVASW